MASPSESSQRKEGIRCKECDKLILGKDDLAVLCPKGHKHQILALLSEAIEQGYLNQEEIGKLFEKQEKTKGGESMTTKSAVSKTKIFNGLIAIGLDSKDPLAKDASRCAQSLNLDIDKIEKILGLSFVIRQFETIECSLRSARIPDMKIHITINPFHPTGYDKQNFYLSVNSYTVETDPYFNLFSCNGLLRNVVCDEDGGWVGFTVENSPGTTTLVKIRRDRIDVSIVGREKNPNLLMAEFSIDQLLPA